MNILELPEELILGIFRQLSLRELITCCYVCRTFHRLVNDFSVWSSMFIEIARPKSVPKRLHSNNTNAGNMEDDVLLPSPRLWSSTVVFNDKLYMYGGHITGDQSNLISSVKNDLYQYDFVLKKWESMEHQMGCKTEHKCVLHDNSLWIVGGYNGFDYTNEIYCYNPITKTSGLVQAFGEKFAPRSALTAIVWRDKMYIFGGWNGFSRIWYNDIYEFDFERKHWTKLEVSGDIPPARTSHASVLYKNKMYAFGGFSGEAYLNDLFEFDLETHRWCNLSHQCSGSIPEPRSRFCASVHNEKMYILGGWNKVGYFADLYTFSFDTYIWTKIESRDGFEIPSLSQYSLVNYNGFFYFFGGYCSRRKQCINELIAYRLNSSIHLPSYQYQESLSSTITAITTTTTTISSSSSSSSSDGNRNSSNSSNNDNNTNTNSVIIVSSSSSNNGDSNKEIIMNDEQNSIDSMEIAQLNSFFESGEHRLLSLSEESTRSGFSENDDNVSEFFNKMSTGESGDFYREDEQEEKDLSLREPPAKRQLRNFPSKANQNPPMLATDSSSALLSVCISKTSVANECFMH